MDIHFQPNNTHLDNAKTFAKTDPHLKRLQSQKYIYHSPLIDEFPTATPGILTLGGGRQIGKTTLLKQWMQHLLNQGVAPSAICFFTGELIDDHKALYLLIQNQLADMPKDAMKYIILDEVTYISDWDKTIKYLADIDSFEKTIVVLSGSDLVLMQDARKRFPGRRGKADKVDFHYYPLSFRETLSLKNASLLKSINMQNPSTQHMKALYAAFDDYLIHGGFLTAINELATTATISIATLTTYSEWIRGDVIRRNKNETFLQEIIGAIIKYYTKQISWDNLVKELTIDHTQTVADYINILSSMEAVFVQSAIIEEKLLAAPKKRKRLMFTDPFIYHAMRAWLKPTNNPFENQIRPIFSDPIRYSELVESCVITHFRRFFPTYYIKAEGEVDVAYVANKRFWPVEVKWTTQLRSKDIKQISKYKNGQIYSKTDHHSQLLNVPVTPLPLALMNIDNLPRD